VCRSKVESDRAIEHGGGFVVNGAARREYVEFWKRGWNIVATSVATCCEGPRASHANVYLVRLTKHLGVDHVAKFCWKVHETKWDYSLSLRFQEDHLTAGECAGCDCGLKMSAIL